MIQSFRPGRVRLRANALCDEAQAKEIQEMLAGYPGVLDVQANTRTGSLLVHYDPEQIPQEQLQIALGLMEQRFADTPSKAKRTKKSSPLMTRKMEYRLLAGTFALCLLGTLGGKGMGGKYLHIAAGSVVTALTARHIYKQRKLLF